MSDYGKQSTNLLEICAFASSSREGLMITGRAELLPDQRTPPARQHCRDALQ
jgi:hypothetical protein